MFGFHMTHDPKIDCLEWHVKFHATHAAAGFEPIPREHSARRYVFLYQWLAERGLVNVSPASIDTEFVLYKSALTPKGWRFFPKICDRFVALDEPGRTIQKDERYLRARFKAILGEDA